MAVVLNRSTTLLAGRHAQAVFRNEARVIELAAGLSKRSDLLDAASRLATVDGPVNALEKAVISELRDRCRRA
jgi:hypothetical protein